MTSRSESELFKAIGSGDERAFAQIYDIYHQRMRLVAWRVSHRSDWIDDLLNETWCRAFHQRTTYNTESPFLVWMAGILRNVYREQCRKSPITLASDQPDQDRVGEIDDLSPETVVHEAEVLSVLNECVESLDEPEATIVRLRFFEGKTLRSVAKEVNIPESTLRATTLPALLKSLRFRLEKKEIEFSEFFSAQEQGEMQWPSGE
ncbi:MAG: sigma-70 family RNA polymerase sigma factor [Phycisphaerales bacterium]|nr:sigma-70 family RNA polymerase sigma factor [Phycisphaerales bacterium]